MSVQDIIYITPLEFKTCKNDLIVCEKVIETYKKLLNTYDCFTKPDLVLLKFPTTTKNNKHNSTYDANKSHKNKSHYHNNNKNYHNSTKHVIPYSSSNKRPQLKALNSISNEPNAAIKRQLQGFLNIINTNNFSKIFNKIKIYVNEDVLDLITDVILDTACCQVFYISIFYNLLMEIRNFVNDTGKSIIDNQISRYVNDYIADELYLYKCQETVIAPENKYHEFCIVQKHKCLATSRNHVVMEIIKNKHVNDWTLQTYCDNLCYTVTNLEYTIVEDSLEVNIDILISMIKDLKQKDKNIHVSSSSLQNIKTLLNNSQRLKFMVEDIAA
jgi:hypothetical protein